MTHDDDPRRLEEQGWEALVAGGDHARRFYGDLLDDDVVMLLPAGLALTDRALMLQTMADSPWSSYELEDVRVHEPTPDTALVTYGVVAHRDETRYSALMSSLYVRRGAGWRMTFHQQTPRDLTH